MRLPGGLSVRALVVGLLGLAILLVFVMPFLTPTPSSWIGSRTPATNDVIDLYWAMFAIAAVILLIVEGGIIASVILFRQRPGHSARAFHGNTVLEFTWTIIPAIIVLGLSAFSFKSLSTLTNTADAQMTIEVTGEYDIATRLFSETPSRIIVSFDESALGDIEEIVAAAGCPMTLLGTVGSDRLRIESDGEEVIQLVVAEMENAWRSSLKEKLQAEAMAAGAE